MWKSPLVAAFALSLAACQAQDAPDVIRSSVAERAQELGCPDVALHRLTLDVADRILSFFSESFGLQAGFVPLLDADVIYLAAGRDLLRGRDAVRAYLAAVDPGGTARLGWDTTRLNASADGRLGYSFGWTRTTQAGSAAPPAYGKNLIAWRHRAGVGWRVVAYLEAPARAAPDPTPADYPLFPDRCPVRRPGRPSAVLHQLLAADTAFAAHSVADGVAVAFRDYAAPDAVVRPGNHIVIGPAAIYDLYLPAFAPGEVLDWAPTDGAGAGSGDLGYTIGLAVDTVPDAMGPQRFYSKYLTVWERQPGGAWRYVVDGGNGRPAP